MAHHASMYSPSEDEDDDVTPVHSPHSPAGPAPPLSPRSPDGPASARATTPTPPPQPTAGADPTERTRHHLYSRQLLSRSFVIPSHLIGTPPAKELAAQARRLEGKCTAEGLVRPGSTSITSHSAGVCDGGSITYNVKIECDICSPVPGQRINKCKIVSITKMGIRAMKPPAPGPVVIYVLRDHYGGSEYYQSLQEGDDIDVIVTAPRFQLNEPNITVLAELIPKRPYTRSAIQPN